MKKLIVFWTLNEMTEASAKGARQYRKTPMKSDFVHGETIDDARSELEKAHGKKPEQQSPTEPSTWAAHTFADIKSWREVDI